MYLKVLPVHRKHLTALNINFVSFPQRHVVGKSWQGKSILRLQHRLDALSGMWVLPPVAGLWLPRGGSCVWLESGGLEEVVGGQINDKIIIIYILVMQRFENLRLVSVLGFFQPEIAISFSVFKLK